MWVEPATTVREAGTLMKALACLREGHPGLTFTEIVTFLAVAENEGVTISGLARLCGYTIATASRTARSLTAPEDPGALAPYRGLVRLMRGPDENRSRFVFLTPAGVALCHELDRIVTESARLSILNAADASLAA